MIQRIGAIIQALQPVPSEALDRAAGQGRAEGRFIGEVLLGHGAVSEAVLYRALARQFSLEYASGFEGEVCADSVRELPADLFRGGRCLPLAGGGGALRVVCADPFDLDTMSEISAICGRPVQTVLAAPSELREVCERLFGGDAAFKQSAGRILREYEQMSQAGDDNMSLEEIRRRTESEPVVRLASLIFNEAIKCRASDIHIEPYEFNAVVRFRVDGMLRQHMDVSRDMYTPLTSRIKILANLDIAEKRVPQDGRIRYSTGDEAFDLRVSTLPTHYGEKTVVRLLKHDRSLLNFRSIGMAHAQLDRLGELIEKPQGMIFVTGPTGSGKSSTLFACLNKIRGKAINITTIENPIEYKLEGVNQVQINEKAGVTFAAALRSILRQDPDVILIGEIRDPETAQIAVQASQTGHLVFSTLHTNDAISAVTRLRDLGVPGFLISSSLVGILAQRLVRVLCPSCKREQPMGEEVMARWKALFGARPLPRSFAAPGCENCRGSGYRGRVGIFELVAVNERIRSMIADNASESELRKYLSENGFVSLTVDGIQKIEAGITGPEELLRVVQVDGAQ